MSDGERQLPEPWEICDEFYKLQQVAEETSDKDTLNLLGYWVAERDAYVANEKLTEAWREWDYLAAPTIGMKYDLTMRGRKSIADRIKMMRRVADEGPDVVARMHRHLEELHEAVQRQEKFRSDYAGREA